MIGRFFRRIVVMSLGFVLAASCGALFLPLAALSDASVREAGFDAAIGGFFALLDQSARNGHAAVDFSNLGLVFWAILVAVCAAPLAFAALVGEIGGVRSWSWYLGASGFLAAASPWIARGAQAKASAHAPSPTEMRVVGLLFLTGALTGLVYWFVAVRCERRTR